MGKPAQPLLLGVPASVQTNTASQLNIEQMHALSVDHIGRNLYCATLQLSVLVLTIVAAATGR